MTRDRPRRNQRPLDARRLEELAIRYVGRYATTRAKLLDYLRRKLRDRGWAGDEEADLEKIASRFAELGYVDDRAFALSKEASHSARGLGARRLQLALRAAGVGDEDRDYALALASSRSIDSALRLAERRKVGPFAAAVTASPRDRDKALGVLIRGGHGFDLSRAIVDLHPGDEEGIEELRRRFQHTGE